MKKKLISMLLVISLLCLGQVRASGISAEAVDHRGLFELKGALQKLILKDVFVVQYESTYYVGDDISTINHDFIVHGVFTDEQGRSVRVIVPSSIKSIRFDGSNMMNIPGTHEITVCFYYRMYANNVHANNEYYYIDVEGESYDTLTITVLERGASTTATPTPSITVSPSPSSLIPEPTPDELPIVPPTVVSTPTPTPVPTLAPTPTPVPVVTPTPKPTNTPAPVRTPSPTPNLTELDNISCSVTNTTATTSNGLQRAAVKIKWNKISSAYRYEIYKYPGYFNDTPYVVCDDTCTSYTDKSVKKGCRYYYMIRAIGGTPGESYAGAFSTAKRINVPTSLIKPVISCSRKGKNMVITFKKAEGTGFEMQFCYAGKNNKWITSKGNGGDLKKKISRKIGTKNGSKAKRTLRIRVRTYMNLDAKYGIKKYSKWSSPKTIKI